MMDQEQIDSELDGKIEAVLVRDASRMPLFPTEPSSSMIAMLGSASSGIWASLTSKILFFTAGAATVGGVWYFSAANEPAKPALPGAARTSVSQPAIPNFQVPAETTPTAHAPEVASSHRTEALTKPKAAKQETTTATTTPETKRPALDLNDADDPNAPHFPLKRK